ncbi:MAG: DUF1573 domain-containing protein [Bacteroidota bacterium]
MKSQLRLTFLLALSFFAFQSLSAQQLLNLGGAEDSEPDNTVIQFEKSEYDLGTVKKGEPAKGRFIFKNVGEAPLVIENVKPSCKCTELIYPEEAIAPGASGEIYAEISTDDKSGDQTKFFAVIYNGNPPVEHVKMIFKIEDEGGVSPEHPDKSDKAEKSEAKPKNMAKKDVAAPVGKAGGQ